MYERIVDCYLRDPLRKVALIPSEQASNRMIEQRLQSVCASLDAIEDQARLQSAQD